MSTNDVVVLVVCELVAALGLAHLWSRKQQMSTFPRVLWTGVILIPVIGIIIYGLARPHPDEHSDEVPQCEDPPER